MRCLQISQEFPPSVKWLSIYGIKEKIISQVKIDIPTYTEKNLPKNLLALKAVKPGSRNL